MKGPRIGEKQPKHLNKNKFHLHCSCICNLKNTAAYAASDCPKIVSRITYLASLLHARPPDETKRKKWLMYVTLKEENQKKKKKCLTPAKVLIQHEHVCVALGCTWAPVCFCGCAQSRPRCGKLLVTFAFPTNSSAHEGRANTLVQECGCDTGN